MLRAVKIINPDVAEEVASKSEYKTEKELSDMVAAHHKTFDKELGEMTSTATLLELLEMAKDGGTHRQVEAVEDRIKALSPADNSSSSL